jgi:hypothetical protein
MRVDRMQQEKLILNLFQYGVCRLVVQPRRRRVGKQIVRLPLGIMPQRVADRLRVPPVAVQQLVEPDDVRR